MAQPGVKAWERIVPVYTERLMAACALHEKRPGGNQGRRLPALLKGAPEVTLRETQSRVLYHFLTLTTTTIPPQVLRGPAIVLP